MSAAPKTVLLVDDDAQFLEILQSLAQSANAETWNVLAAQTTAAALATLQKNSVDVIIVDLRMPVVDGVQFLQLIRNKYPSIKKVLLSGHLDERSRSAATSAGAELVLEKPMTPEGFQNVFAAVDEMLRWQNEVGFRGVLRRVGIEDVIQMECLSRHSLVLELNSPNGRGKIFICKGQLVHAESGDLNGEAALDKLLALTGGEFHHAAYSDPPTRSLEGSWEFLVMEAVRRRDEAAGESGATSAQHSAATPQKIPDEPALLEMVVCDESAAVIHEFQSRNAAARASALKMMQDCAQQLAGALPLGSLERVELFGQPERVVARFSSSGAVFVRGTVPPE